MKRPEVTMEDFMAQAKIEGLELSQDFLETAEIIRGAMERAYNMGYDDGLADGKAARV